MNLQDQFEDWWLGEKGYSIRPARSGDGYMYADANTAWKAVQAFAGQHRGKTVINLGEISDEMGAV